jgi:hypothetical protein
MERNTSGKASGRVRLVFAAGLLALCLASRPLSAARIYPSAGSTSATFLKLGVGARALGMAGAFTAVPGDPYSLYWNPAGLAALDGEKDIGLFHNEYFQGLGQEFLFYTAPAPGGRALGLPLPRTGAWGFCLDYFYVPSDMERRSGLNESDPLNPISPVEGKFGASDMAFSASYARKAPAGWAFGGTFKVIRQSIDTYSGASFAADAGLLRDFSWRGAPLTAGFTMQNLGPGIKLDRQRYGLPLVFRGGLSGRVPGLGALLALDAEKQVDDYPSLALGGEFPLTSRLALRAGYRARLYGNEAGAWSGFSAGAGIAFEKVTLDYAFTPFGDLGNAHRFSLTYRFGDAGDRARASFSAPLPGGAPLVYPVARRALSISPRGVLYELSASSPTCSLASLSFRTLIAGETPPVLTLLEGEMPPELRRALPAGLRPLRVWQTAGFAGSPVGRVKLGFRLKADVPAGKVEFYYYAGKTWTQAAQAFVREEDGYYYFSADAPPSGYYAAAARD